MTRRTSNSEIENVWTPREWTGGVDPELGYAGVQRCLHLPTHMGFAIACAGLTPSRLGVMCLDLGKQDHLVAPREHVAETVDFHVARSGMRWLHLEDTVATCW